MEYQDCATKLKNSSLPNVDGFEKYEVFCRRLGRKWRVRILCILAHEQELRYCELKGALAPITHKMLSEELGNLVEDGFIVRKEYGGVPVKVMYSLSPLGKEFLFSFSSMAEWIDKYLG